MGLDQDVEMEFGGKSYKFRLTNLAIARFEGMTGKTFLEWGATIDQPSHGDMLALLWAGLQYHHKKDGITYDKLGDELMSPAELMSPKMLGWVMQAVAIVFGQEDKLKELTQNIEDSLPGEAKAETG